MGDVTYRPSKVVDWTIRDTSTVLFDDELYQQAISFLSSLLHAGGGSARSDTATHTVRAQAPSPEQLALLSTLAVHPAFTNRCSSTERSAASGLALQLLSDITSVAGPVAADFDTAFAFTHKSARRDVRRRTVDTDSSDGSTERQVENRYARGESVWSQTEDLWQIVGWAFNCSRREPKRWEPWKLWLEWLLDALEADWAERIVQAATLMADDLDAAKEMLAKSMMFRYLSHLEGRNGRRRLMRAILATGDQKALNEFPEVWANETRERKRRNESLDDGPRKRPNLEQDDFGDYGADDDEVEFDSSSSESGDDTIVVGGTGGALAAFHGIDVYEAGTIALGGIDAVNLRHRLMALLYRVALDLPSDFTYVEDLFDLYTEAIRPLPLSQFCVLASNPYLFPQARLALLANHLLPLQNANTRLKGGDIFKVDQTRITQQFLSKAANAQTTIDNAKVSLVLEACLITLMDSPGIQANDDFSAAVEEGIKVRRKRAVADGRKKGKGLVGDEKDAQLELELSSQRLIALLEVVETSAGRARDSSGLELDAPTSSLSELSSVDGENAE